mgnify:CR=1 FL=1
MANLSNLGGNYSLGANNPPTTLESQGITDPYPTELQPFADVGGLTGSKKTIYLGNPVCKWTWGMLTQEQYNKILAFVSGGSRRVYLETRVVSGVAPTYNRFSAMMHYPTAGKFKSGGLIADIELTFTDLKNA